MFRLADILAPAAAGVLSAAQAQAQALVKAQAQAQCQPGGKRG